jgi:hypothetical protein
MGFVFGRGARFGSREQYYVHRKLGEGQFAEVYEVRDASVKDRDQRVRGGRPGQAALPHRAAARLLTGPARWTQFAVKIEKRKEAKSVKGEFKVRSLPPSLAGRAGRAGQPALKPSSSLRCRCCGGCRTARRYAGSWTAAPTTSASTS